MSNQFLKLRRSAVPGKIPDTGSLDLGEIALNTYDGVAFMKKSVGGTESIVTIGNTTGSFTGSFNGVFSGSLFGTASWAFNAVTASTADNFFIRGNVTGSNALFSGTVTAQRLVVQTVSSSVIYSSGSNIFGDELIDTQQFTGSVTITGSLTVNGPSTFNGQTTANNLTGSLFGTSSWARNAVTASHAVTALSSSYAVSASNSSTASFAQTGNGTFSGSFSGSFFGNGAGITNISASSVVGLNLSLISSGSVTASTDPAYGFRVNANSQFSGSTQITGSLGVTGSVSISGSVGDVFSTNIDTMTLTGSFFQSGSTFITGTLGVFGGITGSLFGTSSWAVSASHAPSALTASYAITASNALTASSADNFVVRQSLTASNALINGTLTATTIITQFVTSSTSFVTGSTKFGSLLTNTHQFTGSVTITGSLSVNNDPVVTQTPYNAFSSSIATRATNLESTASILTQASASFSSSIAQLSGSFLAFSQSYNTGSFTGSFTGQAALTGSFNGSFSGLFSGSFTGSVANIDGQTNYIAKFDSPNTIDSSVIYQSSSHIAINETNFTANDPEALYVFQTHPTSINVITGKGNHNNYLQLNIQNTNQGISASSDIVATANNGNEFNNYIDMGINSQNFNTGFIGEANDAYVYSIANNLHIGNAATNGSHLGFFVGGDDVEANMKLQLNPDNVHIMSGSLQLTGSLDVLEGITGSLYGTSSWAISASHAPTALTSSYAISASYALSSSLAANSILFNGTSSGVFATTGSNVFRGLQTIHGNLFMSGSFPLIYNNDATNNMLFGMFDGSSIYGPYYQLFGNQYPNLSQRGGAEFVYDIRNNPNADFHIASFNGSSWTTKFVVNDNGAQVTGSLNVTGGITGSLFGTASWALNALTSSNVLGGLATYVPLWNTNTSLTSSYLNQSGNVLKTTYNGTDRGLALDYNFDSFILGNPGVGNGTYLQVFDGGSTINVYSPNYTYFNDKVGIRIIPTNPGLAVSGSLEVTGPGLTKFTNTNVQITGSLNVSSGITGSLFGTASWAQNAVTSSYILNAVSSSYAATASSADNFFVRQNITASNALIYGTLTAQNIVAQYITSSTEFITGSTKFGTQLTDTHQFTGSVTITGSLSLNNDPVVTQTPYNTFSSSIALRATNLESTASVLTSASASFAQQSGSNSIRLTNLESTASVLTQASASFAIVSSSYASASGSLSIRVTNLESTASVLTTASASFAIVSSSYASASGSLSTRVTNLESTASVLTAASASFAIVSSSFATTSASLSIRTTNLEATASVLTAASASFAIVSSSFASTSASLSIRTTNLESTASVLTAASASFAQQSGSNSIRLTNLESTASVLTTASASFALVSASYSAFSQSYNTGSFTGSFTGVGNLTGSLFGTASWAQNAVTSSYILQAVSASFATTASYAVSSSYAYNADFLDGRDSSVFATTGSNVFVGNQTVTGSLFTSGSNTLIGSTTLTGSLNITGSTVQIGSNTLAGNTTLSGSITISGSLASVPTIKIFGDVQQNGYTRFDPVTTNINTSISASYIFVSGSTNDLYFSQNGKGYSNVTRLRWLEGNLYTGLLNGGLITSQSSTTYQVGSGSGIIVNLNASLNDNPYPTITYVNWPNLTGNINQFSASYDQTFVAISTASTLISQSSAFLNGQVDTQIPVGYVAHQDNSTINGTVTEPSLAYGWKQRSNVFINAFGPLKLSGFNLAVSGSSTGSLIVGSGTAFLDGGNYQTDPNNPSYVTATGTDTSKIFRYYESGSDWVYQTNGAAGFPTIDPARYSNNGTLTSVGAGNWSIQRVFFFPTSPLSPKPIIVYYGNAIYATEAEAIANIPIEPFTEAPSTSAAAIYLGAIVISGNGVFTNASTFTIYPGGLFRQVGGSGGGGSLVTQTLAGLSDVSISGPTNGQPLVYNSTSGKWQNSSTLTANLTGNASTATTASFAVTASYVLQAVSASFATTASFANQASTASYVLQAISASFASQAATASYVLNAVSASYAATASSADNFLVRQNVTASNALITGTLTAQTIIAQYITSSTEFITGSTKFGTLLTDTHQFTGSVTVTGSLSVNNSPVITNATFTPVSSSVSTRLTNLESTASVLTTASSSFAQQSGSNSIRLTNLETTASVLTTASASFALVSASYSSASGSLSTRTTNLETTASVLTQASASFAIVSASYASASGSFSTRVTSLETASGSFSTRVTTLENASASFAIQSGSNSIRLTNLETTASVLTTASASFAVVSASYAVLSGSFRSGSYTGSFTGTLIGTASWASNAVTSSYILQAVSASFASTALTASYVLQAVSASFATQAANATTASYILNAVSASFASTASFVNTLNQNVLITGSLTVGQTSLGANENTLVLGPAPAGGAGEGGQLLLAAPGGTYTSASMWDNYQNQTRLLRGTNAGSDAIIANFNMHTRQVQFPSYNSTTAFTGTVVGFLGFDSNGNILTTTGSAGGGGGSLSGGSTNYVARWASATTLTTGSIFDNGTNVGVGNISPSYKLDVTGDIRATNAIYANANGAMYFRGGDDAELWDINVANTLGVYGQQNSDRGGIKLGSSGPTLFGLNSNLGIGTTSPTLATLQVNGNVHATSFTGSLFGTASWANNAVTSSHALFTVSASFAATASSADNFLIRQNATASNLLVNNTITAQTLVVTTVSSSVVFSSGSNIFGNSTSNVQQFTGSLRVTGSGNHWIMGGNVGFNTTSPQDRITVRSAPDYNLNLGTLGSVSGIYVYNDASSAYNTLRIDASELWLNSFSGGNISIGSNTNPGYKLHTVGSGNFTANLTATGSIRFPSLTSANQTSVVGYNTATGQLFYQTTSSLSVTSASYAATSSYATNFTIQDTLNFAGTLTDYATVASSIVGSNNLFTQATGSYTSGFFKYTVSNGANARTGEMLAVWNGASVQFTDNSTLDIGSTTPVTCSVSLVGGDVLFNVQTNTSGWRIKSIGTFM